MKTFLRNILVVVAFVFSICSTGQNFEQSLPSGYVKVLEAKGDLDKDGVEEIVYVFNTDVKVAEKGFERELFICKTFNNNVKVWKNNKSVLWYSNDSFYSENGITLSVEMSNNTLIISQTRNTNSRHTQTSKTIFRYQNEDWFLIGSTFNFDDTCAFSYQYDINFSTKKVIVDETYDSCDDDDDKNQPKDLNKGFKYPFLAIPRMDGFTPGSCNLKIPNSDRYFYY